MYTYKDPKGYHEVLKYYLDFLFALIQIVENPQNSSMFKEISHTMDQIRKEFDLTLTQKRRNDIMIQVNANCLFDVTEETLRNQARLSPLEELLQKYSTDEKHKGLANLGNTCYINSTIQALYMTTDFRTKILDLKIKNNMATAQNLRRSKSLLAKDPTQTEDSPLHEELYNLFLLLLSTQDKFVEPKAFREVLPEEFRSSYMQQDASEFVKFFFDALEKSLTMTPEKNLINECFAGEIVNRIECMTCQKPVETKDKFLDLSLNFSESGSKEPEDLLKMIKQSFQEEQFSDQNRYFCDVCKKKTDLTVKRSRLQYLPEYLIITLNRFAYNQHTQSRNKISTYVNIYEYFDFKNIFEYPFNSGTAYKMYAVVIHSGMSADAGHYYTFARDLSNEKIWFLFNDKCVLALGDIKLSDYLTEHDTETPYMIFYKRDNPKILGKR
jgi:ubiquitin C-terminal hydrolase